jgi:methyl-accepting chemotaxis protein
MTSATDTDIREIKTAIDGNTRSIESLARIAENIARGTESNTKAIETIAKATEANTKAIADLTLEMRVGFSDLRGQIGSAFL